MVFKQALSGAEFLAKALRAAHAAGHIFPGYAAAEAAHESGWGKSRLAIECNNLFGQKAGHTSREYPTKSLPTHECVNEELAPTTAEWPCFPDRETCFRERMNLLRALPRYALVLDAMFGESFIKIVSLSWATDPKRGEKVMQIFNAHRDVLEGATA